MGTPTNPLAKIVKIIIEKSSDSYSAYAEDVPGIYGHGDTIDDAKKSALRGIELLKKHNKITSIPEILRGEYEIKYECIEN